MRWIGFIVAGLLGMIGSVRSGEIVIVYPKMPDEGQPIQYKTGFDSTFVLGHIVPPTGLLSINGDAVETSDSGAFLAFLPLSLDSGTNHWVLTLKEQGSGLCDTLELPYIVQPDTVQVGVNRDVNQFPKTIIVNEPNSHTRTIQGGSYEFFPPVATRLTATGQSGGFYEFAVSPFRHGFIEQRFATGTQDTSLIPARLSGGVGKAEPGAYSCRFELSRPVLYRSALATDGRSVHVLLFDAVTAVDRIEYSDWDRGIDDVSWSQNASEVELTVHCRERIKRGYFVTMDSTGIGITLYPEFSGKRGRLNRKTIVIDAGHGGSSIGSVGPLGTQEKAVTLRWSILLAQELENAGAHVVQTRESDRDLSLYERIDIARGVHADCFLSLHANALPDGENPLARHGTGTYYYHAASRPLAESIQREMLQATGLRDDGIYDANFAVVRPTDFPAVLLESAYLIRPDEEELLRSDEFLRRMSKAVVRGLSVWFQAEK